MEQKGNLEDSDDSSSKYSRDDSEEFESHIFMSSVAPKNIGSRQFEYDDVYVGFLDLVYSICYQSSLPPVGSSKPPALVPSSYKSLARVYLNSDIDAPIAVGNSNLEESIRRLESSKTRNIAFVTV